MGKQSIRTRTDALRVLNEETFAGVDEQVKRRDAAFHALIESTSDSLLEWQETAQYIRLAWMVKFDRNEEQADCCDLRPAVYEHFLRACPFPGLVQATFAPAHSGPKLPPVRP